MNYTHKIYARNHPPLPDKRGGIFLITKNQRAAQPIPPNHCALAFMGICSPATVFTVDLKLI
ncbi:protein of unknown function [Paraburkholderia kururiensis]